jgi:hypothetical protein
MVATDVVAVEDILVVGGIVSPHDKEIQVTIIIVVAPGGAESDYVAFHTCSCGNVLEGAIAPIAVKYCTLMAGKIDIRPAVIVVIGPGYSLATDPGAAYSGTGCHVGESASVVA